MCPGLWNTLSAPAGPCRREEAASRRLLCRASAADEMMKMTADYADDGDDDPKPFVQACLMAHSRLMTKASSVRPPVQSLNYADVS